MPVVLVVPCTPHSLRVAVAHPVEEEWREGGREKEGKERRREGGKDTGKERRRREGGRKGRRKGRREEGERVSSTTSVFCLQYISTHTLSLYDQSLNHCFMVPTTPKTHTSDTTSNVMMAGLHHSTPTCKNKCTSIGVCTGRCSSSVFTASQRMVQCKRAIRLLTCHYLLLSFCGSSML